MATENGETVRDRGRLSILSCNSGMEFARRVVTHLEGLMAKQGRENHHVLKNTQEIWFPNREVKTVIEENIRGDDVYVIQCVDDPLSTRSVNDNLMALATAVGAAYQSDADCITAVIPQYPYSRQERKKARETITARLVAHILEDAGADRVITLDIHSEAIEGFFHRTKLEDLHASKFIIDEFIRISSAEDLVIVAPDVGGADMARYYSQKLRCPFAVVDKSRDYSKVSVIESMRLVGDVRGKRVLLPDDLIATGGTIVNACRLLKGEGAREITVACSLPFFNGAAVSLLDSGHREGLFDCIIGTDAVFRGAQFAKEHRWYREVSVAPLFAQVILNINERRSVSTLLR